jgi:hypothetical protein
VPTLSVVVPATDAPPTLERCLRALVTAAEGDEVIVVREGGRSAAAARNEGARRASSDVLVFVDADVVVHPDALRRIRAAFDDDPGLTAVFGSYDDRPDVPTRVAAFRNLLHHHVHQQGAGPAETFWTGLGAVRRSSFWDVGGFDEARYPRPSIEDIELGHRLAAAGGRIVLDPTIRGCHLKVWTVRSMVLTDFARRGVPWVAHQVRTGRPSTALNLGARHRATAVAWVAVVVAAILRRPTVALGALGAFIALNLPFYRLLTRRRGAIDAVVGVGLHALHHGVAIASVPVGVAVGLRERRAASQRRGEDVASAGGLGAVRA